MTIDSWERYVEIEALMMPGDHIDPIGRMQRTPPPPPAAPPRSCADCAEPIPKGSYCSRCQTRRHRAVPPAERARRRAERDAAIADRRARAAELQAAGQSLTEIADELAVSRATILADIRAHVR